MVWFLQCQILLVSFPLRFFNYLRGITAHTESSSHSYNPTPASWYTAHNTPIHIITRESLYGRCIPPHTHTAVHVGVWRGSSLTAVDCWVFTVSPGETLEKNSIEVNLDAESDWIWTQSWFTCLSLRLTDSTNSWVRCWQRVCHTGPEMESCSRVFCVSLSITELSHQLFVSLNLFVFHTQPTAHRPLKSNKKNPQGLSCRMGECPTSFSLGWLPAECNKGLCCVSLLADLCC